MVHGDLIGPASQNVLRYPVTVPGADPRFIGPLRLAERVLDAFAGVLPVMPGRARNTGGLEGLPLRPGELRQLPDEEVLGFDEPFGSFVWPVSGSGTFNSCKSPIAFPRAVFVPSSSRIRPLSCSTSD